MMAIKRVKWEEGRGTRDRGRLTLPWWTAYPHALAGTRDPLDVFCRRRLLHQYP